MNERPQIIVSQQLVFVSDVRSLVVVLLAHCLESIFGVDVLTNLPLGHITSVVERDKSLVIRKDTHRNGRGDHDVRSTSQLLDWRFRDLLPIVHRSDRLIRLVLSAQPIFVVGIIGEVHLRGIFFCLDFHLLLIWIKWSSNNEWLIPIRIKINVLLVGLLEHRIILHDRLSTSVFKSVAQNVILGG